MLLLLLHERYPRQPELVKRLRLAFGHWKPKPGTYDLLIDLRVRR
jgi:DNA-binding PadR family transcriptional regulator